MPPDTAKTSKLLVSESLSQTDVDLMQEHFDLTPGDEPSLSIWIIGRPAAGKTTTGNLLLHTMRRAGHRVELVDGESVRQIFGGTLGHSRDDRSVALERFIAINQMLQSRSIIPKSATIMGLRAHRETARQCLDHARFFFLDCPFKVAVERDQKGLYAQALAGEIKNFPGVDLDFECPIHSHMRIDSSTLSPDESVVQIMDYLSAKGVLSVTNQ